MIDRNTSMLDAFTTADDVLRQAIQGISDLILVPGLINLDFADVKTIMSGMGVAMMGTAMAEGSSRAMDAAQRAISSPLLEDASVNGARGVIINVTGGPDMSLMEVNEALTVIQEAAHDEANIIFGAVVDPVARGRDQDHGDRHRLRAGGDHAQLAGRGAETDAGRSAELHRRRLRRRAGAASAPAAEAAASPRLTIARRPALELPGAAQRVAVAGAAHGRARKAAAAATSTSNLELEVPAFLRRSEG